MQIKYSEVLKNNIKYKRVLESIAPLDFRDFEVSCLRMHDVINKMGLQVPADEEPFYSDSLKNNASNEHSRLPWKIGRLYKKLRNVSQ